MRARRPGANAASSAGPVWHGQHQERCQERGCARRCCSARTSFCGPSSRVWWPAELLKAPAKCLVEACTAVACGAEFTMWLCAGQLWSAGYPQHGALGHGTDHEYNAKDCEPQGAPAPGSPCPVPWGCPALARQVQSAAQTLQQRHCQACPPFLPPCSVRQADVRAAAHSHQDSHVQGHDHTRSRLRGLAHGRPQRQGRSLLLGCAPGCAALPCHRMPLLRSTTSPGRCQQLQSGPSPLPLGAHGSTAWAGDGGYGRLGHSVQQDEMEPRQIETFRGRMPVAPDSLVRSCRARVAAALPRLPWKPAGRPGSSSTQQPGRTRHALRISCPGR